MAADNGHAPAAPAAAQLLPPRDAGFAWVVCFGSFLCHFASLGIVYSFSVWFLPFAASFDLDSGEVSWVGSAMVLCMTGLSVLTGLAMDRRDPRVVLAAATLLVCASLYGVTLVADGRGNARNFFF